MKREPLRGFCVLWISAVGCLLLLFVLPRAWPLWATLHLALVGIVVYGNLAPNCAWFGPVITAFQTSRKEVWLTLDDGPDPCYTPKTLELLECYGAKATFFLIGTKILANPDLARAILQRGHSIGNHSATHPFARFWALSFPAACREIDDGTSAITAATGSSPIWFRAPVGMANCFVRAALQSRGMLLVGSSCRGFDGVPTNPDQVVRKLFRAIKPGAILLLHEGSSQAHPRNNLMILEAVLARLRAEGYICVIPKPQQIKAC